MRTAMVLAACLGARGDSSVLHGDALDSDQNASPSSSVSSGEAGRRRGFHFSYSNAVIKYVTFRMPGPNRVRDKKVGGTDKSEESLLSKLLVYFTTSCSIKSLALANPAELAAAATKISKGHGSHGYRKSVKLCQLLCNRQTRQCSGLHRSQNLDTGHPRRSSCTGLFDQERQSRQDVRCPYGHSRYEHLQLVCTAGGGLAFDAYR